MATPEAGWYVNPSGPGRRYWDGESWTEHIDDSPAAPYTSAPASAPPPQAVPGPPPPQQAYQPGGGGYPPPGAYVQQPAQPAYVAPPQQGTSALVVCGYVFAVLMPIVGLILGIVAATKTSEPQTSRHGIFVIVVAVAAFVVWFAIFSSTGDTYRY